MNGLAYLVTVFGAGGDAVSDHRCLILMDAAVVPYCGGRVGSFGGVNAQPRQSP